MPAAFGNSNTILAQASGNPLSGAKTINAGSNLCAVAYVVWNDANEGITITWVTYNGVPMTSMGARIRIGTTNIYYIQGFYLPGPATGSNTLEVTFSSANAIDPGAVLLVYTGVDQTTPLRAGSYTSFSGLTDADGTKLLPISSVAGDRTISASGNLDHLPLSSQTLETSDVSGAAFLGTDDGAGAATVNHTWATVVPNANAIAILGASLAAAGGAAGQPTGSRFAKDTLGLKPWSVRRMAGRLFVPAGPLISTPTRQQIEHVTSTRRAA